MSARVPVRRAGWLSARTVASSWARSHELSSRKTPPPSWRTHGGAWWRSTPGRSGRVRLKFSSCRDRPVGYRARSEVEPAGGSTRPAVLMRVAQMGCGPGSEGERHRRRVLSPASTRARRPVSSGRSRPGHIGHRRGDVDKRVSAGGAEVMTASRASRARPTAPRLPGDEQVPLAAGRVCGARSAPPMDTWLRDDHPCGTRYVRGFDRAGRAVT